MPLTYRLGLVWAFVVLGGFALIANPGSLHFDWQEISGLWWPMFYKLVLPVWVILLLVGR